MSTDRIKRTFSELLSSEPDLMRRMALIDFNMDALKDPEAALTRFNVPDGTLEAWQQKHFTAIVNEAAKALDADPEQIADKDKRTPEQQQKLIEIAGRESALRLQLYLNSAYVAAYKHVIETAESINPEYRDSGDAAELPAFAVLYFFATRPDIEPQKDNALTDSDFEEIDGIFDRMLAFYLKKHELTDAQAFLNDFIDTENPVNEAEKQEIIQVITQRLDSIEFPIDKINRKIWNLPAEYSGKGVIGIRVEKSGSETPIRVSYSIDFPKIEEMITASGGTITRALSFYDKRVCAAAAGLFNNGQNYFSFTALFHAMGYEGRPGKKHLEKLEASIKKLEGAIIMLNNSAEVEAGYKYPTFKYYGSLLPMEFVKAEIDGVMVDSAIHLFREPPLVSFARQRNQFTTVKLDLLQSPVNKTETSIAIEDYLIARIAHEKHERFEKRKTILKLQRLKTRTVEDEKRLAKMLKADKAPLRILAETICNEAGITEKKQRQRAFDTASRFLDHYKSKGNISDFSRDGKGFSITL